MLSPGRVEVRPARSLLIVPGAGLALGVGAVLALVLSGFNLPLVLDALLLLVALVLIPFSGMGVVYALVGANVVVDRAKGSAVWQQGVLGMGVGTRELVPFEKIAKLVIEQLNNPTTTDGTRAEFAELELALVKSSGRRLRIGFLLAPAAARAAGVARLRTAADAVAALSGCPVEIAPELRPRQRRRSAGAGQREGA